MKQTSNNLICLFEGIDQQQKWIFIHLQYYKNTYLKNRLHKGKEIFYLKMHTTHFIYGYMTSEDFIKGNLFAYLKCPT